MLEDKPPNFKRVAQFRQGYAVHQVDALVSRIRAQLRMRMTQQGDASGLSNAELDPVALQTMSGGYRQGDVERYLAEAATTLADATTLPPTTTTAPLPPMTVPTYDGTTTLPLADRASVPESLSNPLFHRPRLGRHGYAAGSVDYLVSLIAQGLAGTMEMTGAQLAKATFSRSPTRSSGYDESEVDAYLEAVIAELDRRQSEGTAI